MGFMSVDEYFAKDKPVEQKMFQPMPAAKPVVKNSVSHASPCLPPYLFGVNGADGDIYDFVFFDDDHGAFTEIPYYDVSGDVEAKYSISFEDEYYEVASSLARALNSLCIESMII